MNNKLKGIYHLKIPYNISKMSFSENGDSVAIAYDNFIEIWNIRENKCLWVFGHENKVNNLVISANGDYAISSCNSLNVCIWDLINGKRLLKNKIHTKRISSLAISANGDYAVSGSKDNSIYLWDVKKANYIFKKEATNSVVDIHISDNMDYDEIKEEFADMDGIRKVGISDDAKYFYALSGEASIIDVWDVNLGNRINSLIGSQAVFDVIITVVLNVITVNDKYVIILRDSMGDYYSWDYMTDIMHPLFTNYELTYGVYSTSRNGLFSAYSQRANEHFQDVEKPEEIDLWDMHKNKIITVFKGHKKGISNILINSNCSRILSLDDDNNIILWETLISDPINQ